MQQPENQRAGARVRVPARQPRRSPIGDADRRRQRRRPEPAPDDARGARARRCWSRLLDRWAEERKAARVLLRDRRVGLDGRARRTRRPARPSSTSPSERDRRRARPVQGRRRGRPAHLLHRPQADRADRLPRPRADRRRSPGNARRSRVAIRDLVADATARRSTPVDRATSYDDMLEGFDPDRINAVVLLTDGQNDDDRNDDLEGAARARCAARQRGRDAAARCGSSRSPTAQDADLGDAAPHRRGHQRRRLRRHRPHHDRQGLHRRRQQLLSRHAGDRSTTCRST